MRSKYLFLLAPLVVMGACSENSEQAVAESVTTLDIEAAVAPPPPAASSEAATDASETRIAAPSPSGGTIPVSLPQIAYRYALGFRLDADAIKPLQERHADMCEALGPRECRIISMRQAEQEGDYSYGSLQLAVASSKARAFSKSLETSSGNVDAELVSSSIEGEDLSKQIVDTEARLRARTLLRDRLMDVLRTRRGTVAELVEAERGVAQVNQEIDQARSWLTEMRGRVAFSQMAITYESGGPAARAESSPSGFAKPIIGAWNALGTILGSIIAFFMLAFTVLLPIGAVIYAGLSLWRWARRSDADGSDLSASSPEPAE